MARMSGYAQHEGRETGASQLWKRSALCRLRYHVPSPLSLSPLTRNQLNGLRCARARERRWGRKGARSVRVRRTTMTVCTGSGHRTGLLDDAIWTGC